MTTVTRPAQRAKTPIIMLGLGALALACVGLKHGSIALVFLAPRDGSFIVLWVLALAFLFVEWAAVIGIAITQVVLAVITVVRSGARGAVPAVLGILLTAAAVVLLVLYGRDFEAGPLLFDSNYRH